MNWQPIETAKHDGREVLVGCMVLDGSPRWAFWCAILDGGGLGCDGTFGDLPTHYCEVTPPEQEITK